MDPTQGMTADRDDRRLTGIAAGMVCLALLSTLTSASPTAAPDSKAQVQANYGKLPLSFEVNQGQTDAQVKFLARSQGYALFLTLTEAVLSLKQPGHQAKGSAPKESASPSGNGGVVLRMQLIDANPEPRVLGKEALPGQVNYLIGKDPAKWRTNIPTYSKVAYEGVYPGVDLVYYGNQRQLEYDFVLAPGVDPHTIKLAFKGASQIEINPAGELVLHTASGAIRLHKPVIYQEIDGARKPVDGGYALQDDRQVGFQVAAYDAARPLVIDPVLVYSTYLGGSEADWGADIAVDPQGQAYVTGFTNSLDFPIKNALQPAFGSGGFDAFVAKFSANGGTLRYVTYLGGNETDYSTGIAVDQRGQAYVTGRTSSVDFPTRNAVQPVYSGNTDAFVAQLSANGSTLRYSTYLGGEWHDRGDSIAVDQLGRAVVTGATESLNFPTYNALQPAQGRINHIEGDIHNFDAFVAQFTANGVLRYSTYLGGENNDEGSGIAVDQQGQAYVTGRTKSHNFPSINNIVQPALGSGGFDAFVAKLSADGGTLRYATHLGSSDDDLGTGIAVDQRGQAYVTGRTSSVDFPTRNAVQPVYSGNTDAFVAQLSADGSTLRYFTYLGGDRYDRGDDIAVDQLGRAVVTGYTSSPDFPTRNALQAALAGGTDVFVAQFTADGMILRYSTYLGGSENEAGTGIAVDPRGQEVYVAGRTSSDDFPIEKALQPVLAGGTDTFVAKIRNDSRP
jgi:hypothetical protein